jgi:D-inositol-3-phosphate glycosyltransferase
MRDLTQKKWLSLLTGGSDRPYVFGLTKELSGRGLKLDLISSDELDDLGFNNDPNITVLNLRGSQQVDAGLLSKITRIAGYYARLLRYAATTDSKIFHILWNNKFEWLDRTLLMLYYRMLGKKVVLTAHNVNAAKRDGNDTLFNRLTLRIQYHLSQNIFVHTQKMKQELCDEFGMPTTRVTVIPFGINNSIPTTDLTSAGAKKLLGVRPDERTILFFGRITPYKGLEYLISAFDQLSRDSRKYRLIIAGRPDNCERYWQDVQARISNCANRQEVSLSATYIPDSEAETYFKAADVLVLPYKDIYQSGVLFLAHSFGLPVIAADVGSLRDDIIEGQTGFIFRPEDPAELEKTMSQYFASDLFRDLSSRRNEIRKFATERHSWGVVSQVTIGVYSRLMGLTDQSTSCEQPKISADVTAF